MGGRASRALFLLLLKKSPGSPLLLVHKEVDGVDCGASLLSLSTRTLLRLELLAPSLLLLRLPLVEPLPLLALLLCNPTPRLLLMHQQVHNCLGLLFRP